MSLALLQPPIDPEVDHEIDPVTGVDLTALGEELDAIRAEVVADLGTR